MVERVSPCSSCCGEPPQPRRPSSRPRLAKFLSYVEAGRGRVVEGRGRAASQARNRQRCPGCEGGEQEPPGKRQARRGGSPEEQAPGKTGARAGRARARRCQSEAPSRARLREVVRAQLAVEAGEDKREVGMEAREGKREGKREVKTEGWEGGEAKQGHYGYGHFTEELRVSPDLNNNKENICSEVGEPGPGARLSGKERVSRARSRRRQVAQVASGPYSLQGGPGPPPHGKQGGRARSKSQRALKNQGPYNGSQGPYNGNQGPYNSNQGPYGTSQGPYGASQGPYIVSQGPYSLGYVAPLALGPLPDPHLVTVTVGPGPQTVTVGPGPHKVTVGPGAQTALLRSRSKSRPRLAALQLSLGTATIWPDRHGIWLPP